MAAFRLLYALTVSLLAAPALYGIEMNRNLLDPLKALAIRLATMVATVVLAAAVKPKALHGSSFWYFAFFWGAFSAVGKLTMALEIFGHIRGVASYWPSKVEPYLLTSHGAAFLVGDGIVQLVTSLAALSAMFNERSFRGIGLLWAGSVLNGFCVFLSFVVIDGYPFNVAILHNVLYVIAAASFLWFHLPHHASPPSPKARNPSQNQNNNYSLVSRIFFSILNVAMVGFVGVRALAAANAELPVVHALKTKFEPAVGELVTSHVVQLLIYVFYLAPFAVLAWLHLFFSGKPAGWLSDWARVFAGVVVNGQAVFLLAQYRPIANDGLPPLPDSSLFYSVHLAFALVPLLFLLVDSHSQKPKPIDYKKTA